MPAILEVDVVRWVRDYLAANLLLGDQSVRVATRFPANLAQQLPLARPKRTGGPDDGYLLDIATITTDWMAATEPESDHLAYTGCTAFRQMIGVIQDGAVVSQVRKLGGPFWVDYENPDVSRHVTTHQVRILAL